MEVERLGDVMTSVPKIATGSAAIAATFNAPLVGVDVNFAEVAELIDSLTARIAALEGGGGGGGAWQYVTTPVLLDGSDYSQLYRATCPLTNISLSAAALYPSAVTLLLGIKSDIYSDSQTGDKSYVYIDDKRYGVGYQYASSYSSYCLTGVIVTPVAFDFRGMLPYANTTISVLAYQE